MDRRAEPIVGWRVWRVGARRDGLRLLSALHDELWLPGEEAVAACFHVDDPLAPPRAPLHEAPAEECACGIYAARRRGLALPYLIGRDDPGIVGRVVGTVALRGVVVEGERGWRGARAYPLRLWAAGRARGLEAGEIAEGLREYGVPVRA